MKRYLLSGLFLLFMLVPFRAANKTDLSNELESALKQRNQYSLQKETRIDSLKHLLYPAMDENERFRLYNAIYEEYYTYRFDSAMLYVDKETFVFAICSVICINAVGFGLPLVAPAFAIGLFLSISDSFKMFDQNLSLTAGGPANSTEMIALNIYNTAFKESKLGQAQAKAVVFLIVVVVISVTQLILSRRKEVEM